MSETHQVQATATTMRVVEALLDRGTAGVTELASELELSKGAVHNHLQTLSQLGFVVRDGRGYRVGSRFLDFGVRARESMTIYQAARAEVARLARSSGEIAAVVVQEHHEAAYILLVGNTDDKTELREGFRRPLHVDAAGKAILAHYPEETVHEILAEQSDWSEADNQDLFEELRTVRERGVAFDRDVQNKGITSVAAPVTTDDGPALGAICVAGPADRMTGKRLEEDITGLVISSAKSISVDLF